MTRRLAPSFLVSIAGVVLVVVGACGNPARPRSPLAASGDGTQAAPPVNQAARAREPAAAETVPAPLFLHVFPIRRNPALSAHEAVLYVQNSAGGAFGELGRRDETAALEGGAVRVRLGTYPLSRDAVEPQYLSCSFVVDCDQPIFAELKQQVRSELSAQPSMDQLIGFVDRHISTKNFQRGFDLASTVAASRTGDCTEHATLLAALARAHGLPSRVVLGLVLLQAQGEPVHAFGHAWVESHDGSAWKVADAALSIQALPHDAKSLRVQYLPIRLLDHEGPGYQARMLAGANLWQVERVELGDALQALPEHSEAPQ